MIKFKYLKDTRFFYLSTDCVEILEIIFNPTFPLREGYFEVRLDHGEL